MLIVQFQNCLLVLDAVFQESVFVFLKIYRSQELVNFWVFRTPCFCSCSLDSETHGLLLCLHLHCLGEVAGSSCWGFGDRRLDACREWIASIWIPCCSHSLVDSLSILFGPRRAWHRWLDSTSLKSFLMLLKNILSMIGFLVARSPHWATVARLHWLLLLSFCLHQSLHLFQLFLHLLVLCLEHLRCCHPWTNIA